MRKMEEKNVFSLLKTISAIRHFDPPRRDRQAQCLEIGNQPACVEANEWLAGRKSAIRNQKSPPVVSGKTLHLHSI